MTPVVVLMAAALKAAVLMVAALRVAPESRASSYGQHLVPERMSRVAARILKIDLRMPAFPK